MLIDARTPLIDPLVETLISAAGRALPHAQTWQRMQGAAPGPGQVRIGLLTSDGLRRIEGPIELLQRDPAGGPSLLAASRLLEQVTRAVK